jgi:hypothetical protein
MSQSEIRLAYKNALASKDYQTALEIVLSDPAEFSVPPPEGEAADDIRAIATDPTTIEYMLIDWDVRYNSKAEECSTCGPPYTLTQAQFDHYTGDPTQEELDAWFDQYKNSSVKSIQDLPEGQRSPQLGLTQYLVKVIKRADITDFDGNLR